MSEEEYSTFSYSSFAGLTLVFDNAKSHAPILKLKPLSKRRRSRAVIKEGELERPQPISPERGLTRWGSQEDLLSQMPKQPSRAPPGRSYSPPWQAQPNEPLPYNPLETRISRIRSRWNSQVCRDEESLGKISLSPPAIPKRCVDDIFMPSFEDGPGDLSSVLSQPEGVCWRRISYQRPQQATPDSVRPRRCLEDFAGPAIGGGDDRKMDLDLSCIFSPADDTVSWKRIFGLPASDPQEALEGQILRTPVIADTKIDPLAVCWRRVLCQRPPGSLKTATSDGVVMQQSQALPG